MPKLTPLTTQEIHLLGCILTNRINLKDGMRIHLGLKKRRKDDKTVLVFEESNHKVIKETILKNLIKHNLIKLYLPEDSAYLFVGIWNINDKELKDHPQYNEVQIQAALGT